MLLPHSTGAEAHWWGGGGPEKNKVKRGRGTRHPPFPMGRPKSPPLLPKHWASASQEKKKWVGVRDSGPDSRMGKKGHSKREGSIYGATSQGLAWEVPFFVEGAERRHLWAEWSRAKSLVCRLVAQERNPVIGASKWWELQDCQSLAETWSTWILGCSPKKEGTVALQGMVPDVLEPTMPDSGLGAPQEKGHHNHRQWNSSKIKDGEKR